MCSNDKMKKLLILPIVLACSLSFGQTFPDIKPDAKTITKQKASYIKPSTKVLKYEISVREENKDILKSSFEIKNGNEFILLNKEVGIQDKDLNQKTGVLNREEVMSTMEGTEKEAGDVEQLKLIANIGKDNNIFSEFSWKTISLSNTKKMALLSQENKALATETIPIVHNNDSKVLITHSKNNETFFILDKKEFTIKAVY
jgi:hypothetical protein